jgi:hypothetical protein
MSITQNFILCFNTRKIDCLLNFLCFTACVYPHSQSSVMFQSAVLEALILPDGTGSVLKAYKLETSSTGKLTVVRRDQNATETNLISQDIIRVVEVRSHPLGSKDLEIVAVLEVASSCAEAKVQRYFSLDAARIASAVIDTRELNCSIEVFDAKVSQI